MTSKTVVCACALVASATAAFGQVRITEWMYGGLGGEFVELANVGGAPIDMTGWSYDDDSRTPGSESLTAFGVVLPGQSVVFTEVTEAIFRAEWGIPASVPVIGGVSNNLGRNDEINIYDAAGTLADRLTFGDQTFPGTIRTNGRSGNPASPAALGANNPALWVLSANGDSYGSLVSTKGDIGNPGVYAVPAPGVLSLLALAGLATRRRR